MVNAELNVQEEGLRGDAPVDELLTNEELKHEERKMSEMTNSSGNGRYKHQRSLETMSSSEEEQEEEDDSKQSPEQGRSSGFRLEGDAKRSKISNHSKGIHRQPPKSTRIRKKKDDRESPP